MLDLSFTGGSVVVEAPAIGKTNIVNITEFSDEGTPVEVDEIEVTGHSITMNGLVIRWRKPAAFTAKVTVIPGSDADISLSKLLLASRVQPTGSGVYAIPVESLVTKMTIIAPQLNKSFGKIFGTGEGPSVMAVNTWVFDQGCIVSGVPAVSADAEGKMQPKTYSLVFERLDKFDANGTPLVAGTTTL